MNNIESIKHYESSYDLLMEEYDADIMEALTEDEKDYLRSVDDYEGVSFFLVNGDTVFVCDRIVGGVEGWPVPLEDFARNALDYVREEVATW